jgi:arabinose-5-phosphate isomerase
MHKIDPKEILTWAQEALTAEGLAVVRAASQMGDPFVAAVETILAIKGKVVLTGIGKSGHVARKIASTLASTGTSAFFLHPTEALHGDFGMLQPQDVLVALAYGGETAEVIEVAKHARRVRIPVISITGKPQSSLGQLSDHILNGAVEREICPLNLAPTSSSLVALAIGDCLAVVLMRARGFREADFASLHPAGSLGKRLALVQDHMRPSQEVPTTTEDADFHKILEAITGRNFGIVAVVDSKGRLTGAVSDGDIRRALKAHKAAALSMIARDLMTPSPKSIDAGSLAVDAFRTMEKHQITSLFVADSQGRLGGLVRMHDLLAARIV